MLFNDGPEAAPFMVTVELEGGHRGSGGAGEHGSGGGKEKLPFEVSGHRDEHFQRIERW